MYEKFEQELLEGQDVNTLLQSVIMLKDLKHFLGAKGIKLEKTFWNDVQDLIVPVLMPGQTKCHELVLSAGGLLVLSPTGKELYNEEAESVIYSEVVNLLLK